MGLDHPRLETGEQHPVVHAEFDGLLVDRPRHLGDGVARHRATPAVGAPAR